MQNMIPLSQRTDPPKAEPRVRVRLKFLRDGGHVIAGEFIKPGPDMTAEVVCYKSELPTIQQRVETDAEFIRAAESAYKRKLKDWIAKRVECDPGKISDDRSEWTEAMAKAEKTFPGSAEAEFCGMTGHGIRPLASFEVVEKDLPPPLTPEMQMAQAFTTSAGSARDDVDDLKAQIARLEKMVRDMSGNRK